MLQTFVSSFQGSGAVFMVAITLVGAFCAAVLGERAFLLGFTWRVDEAAVLARLAVGDVAGARALVGAHPVGTLLQVGESADTPEGVWDRVATAAPLLEAGVLARIPLLGAAANLATMLGLLGTVYGLIVAFDGLGASDAAARAARLSDGIAGAMATTAWGLVVGIPSLGAHALLDGRARRLLAFCEAAVAALALSRRRGN